MQHLQPLSSALADCRGSDSARWCREGHSTLFERPQMRGMATAAPFFPCHLLGPLLQRLGPVHPWWAEVGPPCSPPPLGAEAGLSWASLTSMGEPAGVLGRLLIPQPFPLRECIRAPCVRSGMAPQPPLFPQPLPRPPQVGPARTPVGHRAHRTLPIPSGGPSLVPGPRNTTRGPAAVLSSWWVWAGPPENRDKLRTEPEKQENTWVRWPAVQWAETN